MRLRAAAFFLALLLTSACTGVRVSNPGSPVPTASLRLELGSNTNASVSRFALCLSSVTFVPAAGGSPTTVYPESAARSASSNQTPIMQATLPQGAYQQIQAALGSACGSSVAWTNTSGSYASSQNITLSFATSFVIDAATQAVSLGIQSFADQLASTNSGSAAPAALQAVSGTVAVSSGAGGVNLEVPIETLDEGVASQTTSTTFERSRISLDASAYDGTVSYTWEIGAFNSDTVSRGVSLVDSAGAIVATIAVPGGGTEFYAPPRYSTAFTPAQGADTYRIQLDATTSADQLFVSEARFRVRQVGATRTKIYIPLVSGQTDDSSDVNDADQGADTVSSTYQVGQSWYSMWTKDDSKFSALASGAPWTFEAVLSADAGTAYASLFDANTGLQISASEVSTSSATPTLVSQSFSDTTANFTDLDPVQAELKVSASTGYVYRAGIWVQLSDLAHAELYYRVSLVDSTAGGDSNSGILAYNRTLFDASAFNAVSAYYELVGSPSTSGTSCVDSLFDAGTSDSSLNGSNVAGSSLTYSSTNLSILRSGPLELTSGDRYLVGTDPNPGPGSCDIVDSFLVLAF